MVRSTSRLLRFVAIAAITVLAIGCKESTTEPSKAGTVYGPEVTLGKGTARSYAILDDQGKPTEIGVALSDSSLSGLSDDGGHSHDPSNFTMLTLPANLPSMPFNHISLDWNPVGHEPPGIYDLPHFDFHFYMISPAERDAITPTDSQFVTKGTTLPAAEYIPQGYILPPGSTPVPQMGNHLLDPTSPELNGQVFTKTFIYGMYDARIIFVEPMITRAYILSKPNSTESLKLPAKYQKSGYYPTTYSVKYDTQAREHRIGLGGLTLR